MFVASNNAFSFISSVKCTPAYWKQFLYDVLAMVKYMGTPIHFLTLSCADLIWEELPYIINKLHNLGPNHEELKKISFKESCNLLNNKPVLVASDKKQEILTWRNTFVRQIKSYIDNNLSPGKVNVKDPIKDIFSQPLYIKEIINELDISKDD